MILAKTVMGLGFQFLEASEGKEGLAQLEEHANVISLILVDWNMPIMNGYDFVVAVRERPEFNDHKIVMVTTETDRNCMAQALMAGVDEFVMKPFTSSILIEKLRLIGVEFADVNNA